MTNVQSDLITLLRHVVCGAALPEGFAPSDPEALYRLAHEHDLAHIVGTALLDSGLLADSELVERFAYDRSLAIWRVGVLEREYTQVCAVLESASIDYLPLKGVVIRALYLEPWMRTSADLDVLVREEDLARAEEALSQALSYTRGSVGRHDHHMVSPSGFHLELHFRLAEQGDPGADVLQTVWEKALPARDGGHAYCMPEELFYFYHVCHAAKHLRSVSCGVRPVLDTWMILHCGQYDIGRCRASFADRGPRRFEAALVAVAEAWFSGSPLETWQQDAETLFFLGGVYPCAQNLAAAQAISGGRLGYLLWRVFPPYDRMCMGYPILRRHGWLLPACHVHRLCKAIVTGKSRKVRRELRTVKHTHFLSKEVGEMLSELELVQ